MEFDSDFSLNIRYVPGALQACAFSVLLGTGLLAGWIRMFEGSYCARLERLSNGTLTLEIRFVFVLILAFYCPESVSFPILCPSGVLPGLRKPLYHSSL